MARRDGFRKSILPFRSWKGSLKAENSKALMSLSERYIKRDEKRYPEAMRPLPNATC